MNLVHGDAHACHLQLFTAYENMSGRALHLRVLQNKPMTSPEISLVCSCPPTPGNQLRHSFPLCGHAISNNSKISTKGDYTNP